MSILDQPTSTAVTPAQREAAKIRADAFENFSRLVAAYEYGLKQFWDNPNATPAEIAAALGTDAAEVFQLHGTLATVIRQVKPNADISSASDYGTYTVNADGTVTVG